MTTATYVHYNEMADVLRSVHGPVLEEARAGIDPVSRAYGRPVSEFPCLGLMYASMGTYAQSGEQTYVIEEGMWELFQRTKLRCKFEEVKLPYGAFWIAAPGSSLRIWGGTSGWHSLDGFYVSNIAGDEINIWCYGRSKNADPTDDASAYVSVFPRQMKPGWTMEDYFDFVLSQDKIENASNNDDPTATTTPETAAGQRELYVETIRAAVNLCLYLQSDNRDISVSTRKGRLEEWEEKWKRKKNKDKGKPGHERKQIDKMGSATITRIAPQVEERWNAGVKSGVKLESPHWVTGHYKTQRFGKSRSESKRIWVAPYLRGPDDKDTTPRVYKFT